MTLSLNELRERIKDASASLADEADGVLGTEADDLRAEIIEAADAPRLLPPGRRGPQTLAR